MRGEHYKEFLPVQTIGDEPGSRKVLTYIQSLPIGETYKTLGTAVILLDAEKIEKLLKKNDLPSFGVVYILDPQNQIVMSSGDEVFLRSDLNETVFAGQKYVYDRVNHQEVVISQTKSTVNKWRYISVVPTRVFMQKVYYIRNLTIMVTGIELLAGLALSYLLARRNYLPIRKLVEKLKNGVDINPAGIKNELVLIEEAASSAVNEMERIRKAIQKQKPIMRANVLMQLIKGNAGNLQNVQEHLQALDANLNGEMFCVLTAHIDDCRGFVRDDTMEQRSVIKFVIGNVLEELANNRHTAWSVDMDWEEVCLIINLKEKTSGWIAEMYDLAYRAKEFVSQKFSTTITVAIGSLHEGVEGINLSYRESSKALEYKMVRGQGSVIAFEDVKREANPEYVYPIVQEVQLLNFIKVGDSEKVQVLLDEIFNQNFRSRDISMEMARCLFFDIMSTGLKVLSDVDFDYGSVFGEGFEPLSRITGCSTVDEMHSTLKIVYQRICEYVTQNKKSHNDQLKERILSCIDTRYTDSSFSLTAAADVLSINSSYLSHFFKEQTGENFVDYLNKVRIKRAKELLTYTGQSLPEIAMQVGYSNGGYLIRAFKKVEGITPGRYREYTTRQGDESESF